MKALPLDTERLTARRQDLHTRSSLQHLESQSSGGRYDMLAVVEHEEHLLVPQKGEQAGERILRRRAEANCRAKRFRQQRWIANGSQIDKPNTVVVTLGHPLRSRDGDAGLTDTARSDKRN